MEKNQRVAQIKKEWKSPRWNGIIRPYTAEEVEKLKGSLDIEHTLAKVGADRLWALLNTNEFVRTFGAQTGAQAKNIVQAGLKAIYCSGWQVAADANLDFETYPDQSLYPVNSVPKLVERINNALLRADQIQHMEGEGDIYWLAPIVADAEAGFGGKQHGYELARRMIKAGAAGVHYEDQLASEKKCGHLGGKVLIPTSQFINTLVGARLAADVMGTRTLVIARTDANAAKLLTSDIDDRDKAFLTGEKTAEGFYRIKSGLDSAIARAISYAPYADLLWCETSKPNLDEAKQFAEEVHAAHPGKMLAYNCSPSFNWKQHLDDRTIANFQNELGAMGYKFQFITLAGWHANNHVIFELANDYRKRGMSAYVELQEREFASEKDGYTATKHQREVGTGYFDAIVNTITQGKSETTALEGSTEAEQFH